MYSRSRPHSAISCGSGGNEGDAGVGAIHIPGTPTAATVGASIMNSCFRSAAQGTATQLWECNGTNAQNWYTR
ncbi:M57 family metalloprotease [Corallococcus exercitus]|uniref:M57 family metalloprotease n=1 Tax=Corallococcus exercitus TaxID=2316736 RepID=UPI003F5AE338